MLLFNEKINIYMSVKILNCKLHNLNIKQFTIYLKDDKLIQMLQV